MNSPLPTPLEQKVTKPRGEKKLISDVFVTDDEIVICGIPYDDEKTEPEHNCDEMGCGQYHVLIRVKKPTNWEAIVGDRSYYEENL